MLLFAAILLITIGLIHSYLGEKYILIRLFRRDNLPHLQGSDWFTKQTLRFAWHITTLAWWGFAAILLALSNDSENIVNNILLITASVFLVSGIVSVIFSKGKHLSWVIFLLIAGLAFYPAIMS